jgi:nicotinamide riboside transporter PnuC
MKWGYLLLVILGIPMGAVAMFAGEADDSPGLQGLGLILLIYIFFRSWQESKKIRKKKP